MNASEELRPIVAMIFRFIAIGVWLVGLGTMLSRTAVIVVSGLGMVSSSDLTVNFLTLVVVNACVYGGTGAVLFFGATGLANLVIRGRW